MAETATRPDDEPSSLIDARLIDHQCDRFEAAWRARQHPAIEAFLADVPSVARLAALRELMAVEVEYRRREGETPSPDDYETRFEDASEVVASVFQQVGCSIEEKVETTAFLDASTSPPTVELRKRGAWPTPTLPGYEILGWLGAGGMGVVYKARQCSLNRVVAVKLIRPDVLSGPRARARFRREAEAAARLRHLNVIQVHEIGEYDNQPYAVLEYVDGRTLAQLSVAGPLPVQDAAELVEKLARAVQHAHDNGVLHRDLKPANVLVAADGTPKIADFGLARWLGSANEQTATGDVLGTPSYMAPEQASGQLTQLAPATDVYSLGAILYELLTGRAPFRGRTLLETIEQVRSQEPIPPRRMRKQVPGELETICLKCLAKEPRDRYPSAAALAEDLQRWLAGKPIQARPKGWLQRVRQRVRPHRAKVALVLGGVLAVGAALAAPGWLRGPSPEELESRQQEGSLAVLQNDLAAGQAVELIGKTGAPRYFRWQTSAPRQQTFVRDEGVFTIQAQDEGLLELVPDPMHGQYRFHAEVRQDLSEGILGSVGLYFAHARFLANEGQGHSFCKLSYNDLGDEAGAFPNEKIEGNALRLYRHVLFEPILGGPSCGLAPHTFFTPAGPKAKTAWRKLTIEVRSDALVISWEGQPVSRMTRADILGCGLPPDSRCDTAALQFEPRGGLGLCLYRSTASFRNVELEPILEE
jgi:tRNA A-37 threonylcarbamoyl transferase component Bud32